MALRFALSYHGSDHVWIRARRWPFRIGRDARNDLCLARSSRISRRHAKIYERDGAYYLVVSGRNPSYLNGLQIPLDQPQLLSVGDVIEFPDYSLEVEDAAEREVAAGETMNVRIAPSHSRLIRMIAASLAVEPWTPDAVVSWLKGGRRREVYLHRGHLHLCLAGNLDPDTLTHRLTMFEELQQSLAPGTTEIEVVSERTLPDIVT
jgi:pSer/pThr/pTyr-binding forkhead associated (FHA) protein